jgi:hypothetical protein
MSSENYSKTAKSRQAQKPSSKGAQQRFSATEQKKSTHPPGSCEDFEYLLYSNGRSSNIVKFRETAFNFVLRELGNVARLILTGTRYEPPAIPDPPEEFDQTNDPFGNREKIYLRKVQNREDEVLSMRNKEPQVYAYLWGNLSKESREQVQRKFYPVLDANGDPELDGYGNPLMDNDWDNVKENTDPVRLMKRIIDTHLAPDTGVAPVNRNASKRRYEGIRQGQQEPLLDLKQRFVNAIESMEAVGAQIESDEDQAARFIDILDPSRFGKLKADTTNWAKNNIKPYPQTLNDAFEVASTYRIVTDTGGMVNAAAFVTDQNQQNRSQNQKSKGKGKQQKNETADHGNGHQSKTPNVCTKECPICHDPTPHWQRDCPVVAEAKRLHARRQNASVTFARGAVADDGVVLTCYPVGEPLSLVIEESTSGVNVTSAEPFTEIVLPSKAHTVPSTKVLLDNQASVSVFCNPDLLHDIRTADVPCRISGINNLAIVATEIGDFNEFKDIYYHPEASANVLSFSQTDKYCDNDYDPEFKVFRSIPPGGPAYQFFQQDGLYVYDTSSKLVLGPTTVDENLQLFSVREQEDAKMAKELSHRLAYPSPKSLVDILNTGSVINAPVSSKDVARATKIFGPDLASLRGKSHRRNTPAVKFDYLPRQVTSDLVMNADIMFVDTLAFLISVTTPLGLTMVNALGRTRGSRSAPSVKKALFNQIANYKSRDFMVKTLRTDKEGSIASMTEDLMKEGINVNPEGSGSHVPVIERKIQEVKERARAIVNILPWRLALNLVPWLVFFCVSRINLIPHKSGLTSISPTEAFKGRKIDWKTDLRVGFGDYAECVDPYADNTLKSRTHAAIALLPTGNATGSVTFMSLLTGRTIVRDQFKILPVPNFVIDHMNKLADLSRARTAQAVTGPVNLDFALGQVPQPVLDDLDVEEEVVYPPDNVITIDDSARVPVDEPLIITPDPIYIEHPAEIDPTIIVPDQNLQPEVAPPVSDDLPQDSADSVADDPLLTVDPPGSAASTEADDQPVTIQTPTLRYETRSRLRGDVAHWDPKTQMIINPSEHVLLTRHTALEKLRERSAEKLDMITGLSFNISVKKALKSKPKAALESLFKELTQMVDKNVFAGVPPSVKVKKRVIKSFIFLKEKYKSDGSFDKLKSRLVANGSMEDRLSVLFEDISSPTASLPFIFLIACIAARDRRFVKTIDIGGAYLNADISKHDIYMELDETTAAILVQIDPSYQQYLRPNGTMIVKLKKALYGCIESAKLWYDLLALTLESNGFTKNPIDPCVFNKEIDGVQCTAVVYVDDIFVTCLKLSMIEDLERYLRERFKEITVHDGYIHSYLGMTWDFGVPGEVKVTMKGYVEEVLKVSQVTGTVSTPASEQLFSTRDATLLQPVQKEEFHSIVAKMLYLAKRTRPDLLLPITFLTTRVQAPDEDDWSKLQRVMKYLNGSKELGIVLRPRPSSQIDAYIDASYGVHIDGKSHSGMFISLGAGPVLVKSVKQKIVTKSSTEAELIALSDLCSVVIWTRDFLVAQGEEPPPATIFQDNQSTIALAEKGFSTSDRTKHVKIRYFWVKDRVDSGEIKIVYIPTEDMIADILTKPLQGEKFRQLRMSLLNWVY